MRRVEFSAIVDARSRANEQNKNKYSQRQGVAHVLLELLFFLWCPLETVVIACVGHLTLILLRHLLLLQLGKPPIIIVINVIQFIRSSISCLRRVVAGVAHILRIGLILVSIVARWLIITPDRVAVIVIVLLVGLNVVLVGGVGH